MIDEGIQKWIDEIQSEIDSYKRKISKLEIQVRRREILIERIKENGNPRKREAEWKN